MYKPQSSYRIQFNRNFNFKSFEKIIPYLKSLGVDTIYASPIFKASPGSTHGYDVTDPLNINPEIGTEKQLFALSRKLKSAGIKWLQDIVPNHMAFHSDNAWLMDILKVGKESAYAGFFDIDLGEKPMVPFLGENLEGAILEKAIKVKKAGSIYHLEFGGNIWPINDKGLRFLESYGLFKINQNTALMSELVDMQYYRPCNWQETRLTINYRRFFTVNSLICLNIQQPEVFNAYHAYIFKLVEKGIFQGLRVDHIDGLYDPEVYLQRLRKVVGDGVYITVEKILEENEQLPSSWAVQGTSGYDFLAMSNNLFTNQAAQKPFDLLYRKVTGKKPQINSMFYEKKTAILYGHMQGELDNLFKLLMDIGLVEEKKVRSVGVENLKKALGEMLIQMPVYRYYNYKFPLAGDDWNKVETLIRRVTVQSGLEEAGRLLEELLLGRPVSNSAKENKKISRFYQRCMQFTGPLMAKGIEDTLMFTFNRFIGHNEVGDAAGAFGMGIVGFHSRMTERARLWPLTLNASATHDTKRGEDVRARLNVLTDIPKEWSKAVKELMGWSDDLQNLDHSISGMHPNDIYLMVQTVLGSLPMPGEDGDNIGERLEAYVEKALREAKKRSDWAEPNGDYEGMVKDFVRQLINPDGRAYQIISKLLARIVDFAVVNSLSQLLLKFSCPGIPDIYQGCELWDLSLVDPDNRRPVHFDQRAKMLREMQGMNPKKIWGERYSGKIKLWLTTLLMKIRRDNLELFENGEYIALEVKGRYGGNVLAFLRKYGDQSMLFAVPLGLASLTDSLDGERFDWEDTEIVLPKGIPMTWQDLLWGKPGAKDMLNGGIRINQLFTQVPIAVVSLVGKKEERSAGVLMHVTSLASSFGIGDLGPSAKSFIDFLSDASQRYWQILPLSPTKAGNGHSPYSSSSAFAGNVLLISPEGLFQDGLLSREELQNAELEINDRIDFAAVEKSKGRLLDIAYGRFLNMQGNHLLELYEEFCSGESGWLDDFALYTAIKDHHKNREWYHWSEGYRNRNKKTLQSFLKANAAEIGKIKWQQFIFYRQWTELKRYARGKAVGIIGDLPFYVDFDSVEVWVYPELFKLDYRLSPEKVAGVPPDYFNDKGQLWGMPVFDWERMKREGFSWWKQRLEKNLELFDLIRLDHFRAFASFWEVDAGDEDATDGVWVKGPGLDFFRSLEWSLGSLAFIAEDLGEISAEVEFLRDELGFPGMKVVQFAFGDDLLASPNIPHHFRDSNCVVYSGTHDNNTVKGWYENELDVKGKRRLDLYAGPGINGKNVHRVMARIVYSSRAKVAILPVQDLLGLDDDCRMNTPGAPEGNWLWRLGANKLDKYLCRWLREMTEVFGRG